jgi:hypothetical protein
VDLRINPTIIRAQKLLLRYHWLAAATLVLLFFGLSFGSMRGDSAIVDELAHIPAAYSYVHYGDYRLNPEHPPLIKDLAGLPLQFLDLRFPTESDAWVNKVNDQYGVGYEFIYQDGNDAKSLIFWSRLPILLFATAFGIVLYCVIRKRFGTATGLLTLFFYALSPNILAHAHYVTTDVGATIGMFIALLAIVHYFEKPSRNSILILSGALALAQLCKFSSTLLYPFMLLIWAAIIAFRQTDTPWKSLRGIIGASLLSTFWIYLFYIPNTIHLSAKSQSDLFYTNLYTGVGPAIAHALAPLSPVAILRPLLQYILGIVMVFIRVNTGNVTFFNGDISTHAYHGYFPEIFVLKTQVAFLILLIALPTLAAIRYFSHRKQPFATYLRRHRFEFVMASFALYYFGFAVVGNLNLGIRHILPIYPPLFVLVALGCVRLVRSAQATRKPAIIGLLVVLLGWYGFSTVSVYPNFISYFNGLAGGPTKANQYFSDSGIDWGQDLDRLKTYIDTHSEINTVAIDYFGGGMPSYTFCDHVYATDGRMLPGALGLDCNKSKFVQWHSDKGHYTGQYIAVSETFLNNDLFYSVYNNSPSYAYLRSMEPLARIGNSIYLYKLY